MAAQTDTTTTTTPLPSVPAGKYTVDHMLEQGWISCWGDLYAAIDAGHAKILPDPCAGVFGSEHWNKPQVWVMVFF